MNPTVFEISVAIIILVVSVAMLLRFKRYRAAASTSRMIDMMSYFALDPEIGTNDDPQTEAIMKEVRQRCRKCQAKDVCEQWLVGRINGRSTFCPNARTYRMLARTANLCSRRRTLQAVPSSDRYFSGQRSALTPE